MSQKFDLTHVQALDTFAKGISTSTLLPADFKGKANNILAQIQLGHELGVSPMTALSGIHVIKGKPTISANLMITLIMASDKGIIEVLKETNEVVEIKGTRYGVNGRKDTEYVTSFTIQDAQKAQLTGNDNWKKYPKDMLFSKALGRCARRLFPDVIQGMYAQGELDGPSFGNGPDVVSDMGINPDKEVKPEPAKKAPKKSEPKKEKIIEAEVVVEETMSDAAKNLGLDEDPDYVAQFKAHILRVTEPTGFKDAILEWNQSNPEYEVVNHKELGTLVKLAATFLRNPGLDGELGDDGVMYSRDLTPQF